jgi:hypothetical protein
MLVANRLEPDQNLIHLRGETALVLYGFHLSVHKGSKILNIVLLGAETDDEL